MELAADAGVGGDGEELVEGAKVDADADGGEDEVHFAGHGVRLGCWKLLVIFVVVYNIILGV